MCVSIIALVAKAMLFTWILIIVENIRQSCYVTSVRKLLIVCFTTNEVPVIFR